MTYFWYTLSWLDPMNPPNSSQVTKQCKPTWKQLKTTYNIRVYNQNTTTGKTHKEGTPKPPIFNLNHKFNIHSTWNTPKLLTKYNLPIHSQNTTRTKIHNKIFQTLQTQLKSQNQHTFYMRTPKNYPTRGLFIRGVCVPSATEGCFSRGILM